MTPILDPAAAARVYADAVMERVRSRSAFGPVPHRYRACWIPDCSLFPPPHCYCGRAPGDPLHEEPADD